MLNIEIGKNRDGTGYFAAIQTTETDSLVPYEVPKVQTSYLYSDDAVSLLAHVMKRVLVALVP
jgi:hypothetical protein